MNGDYLLLGAAGVGAAVLLMAALSQLSPAARLRRRLRKTHSRIVSKTKEPTVKFSVKTPKDV
jgi:hypothetical protein